MIHLPAAPVLSRTELYLTILIPVISFTGILLAVLLENLGVIPDAGQFYWGCVIGAFLLGYLAYIKPRRDLVSLCVPVFAVLIFLVPMDFVPNIPLQLLFAVSMSLLLVRLHLRFSEAAGAAAAAAGVERFLQDYTSRIAPRVPALTPEAAGALASVYRLFRTGRFERAIAACDTALGMVPDSAVPVKRALEIVSEQLMFMEASLAAPESYGIFSEQDRPFLALDIPKELVKDEPTLLLDNALILIYAVADISLPAGNGFHDDDRKVIAGLVQPYVVPAGTGK
jgi:hypothetical protein